MTRFICIGGEAMSGKDTTAVILKHVLEDRGYKVLITHYADLLKFICRNYFGWNGEKDEYGRSLLQRIGTDCVRKKNPDFWVDFILEVIGFFEGEWDYVILPDARFQNELFKIEEAGYKMFYIRVRRLDFDNTLTEEQRRHPSETSLNFVAPDITIINRTFEQLRLDVEEFCPAICNWFDNGSFESQGGDESESSETKRGGS